MYEKLAWENFCKTGDLESFLEYKKIKEINSNIQCQDGMKGEDISEFNKSQRDSDKGNSI